MGSPGGNLEYLPCVPYYSRKVLRNNDGFNAKIWSIIGIMTYEKPINFIYKAYDSVATLISR